MIIYLKKLYLRIHNNDIATFVVLNIAILLIPYLFFGDFYAPVLDNLDSDVVYNAVIGRFYMNALDFKAFNLFLGGSTEWFHYARIFQPLILLYALMTPKAAYLTTQFIIVFLAFLSIRHLLIRLDFDNISSKYLSFFFSLSISYTTLGIGVVTLPFVLSIILFERRISQWHTFLLIFIGLNSTLILHTIFFPIAILICSIILDRKFDYLFGLKVFLIIFISSIFGNLGLILAHLFSEPSHRTLFIYEAPSLINISRSMMREFAMLDFSYHSIHTPAFFSAPIIIACLLSSSYKLRKSAILICALIISLVLLSFINYKIWAIIPIFKSIQFDRLFLFYGVFFTLLIVVFLKYSTYSKIRTFIIWILILYTLFCITERIGIRDYVRQYFKNLNSEKERVAIKYYIKDGDYKMAVDALFSSLVRGTKYPNLTAFGFDMYYQKDSYACLRTKIQNDRVISIGIDPMIAPYNQIASLDGYHNFYPAFYKEKFREVIHPILKSNDEKRKYFDNWGSRVYSFVDSSEELNLNFESLKKMNGKYIISGFILNSFNLINIELDCKHPNLYLYIIQ